MLWVSFGAQRLVWCLHFCGHTNDRNNLLPLSVGRVSYRSFHHLINRCKQVLGHLKPWLTVGMNCDFKTRYYLLNKVASIQLVLYLCRELAWFT